MAAHVSISATLAALDAAFEKTCEATQKNVKSHIFLDFEKKNVKNVKNIPVGLLNL